VTPTDGIVLLVKEETVVHGMIYRLNEVGRPLNVDESKVVEFSRQPSPIQIRIDLKSWRM